MENIKVVFEMEDRAVFNFERPIHLDGLLVWAMGDKVGKEIELPLAKWKVVSHSEWGWCASALFPMFLVGGLYKQFRDGIKSSVDSVNSFGINNFYVVLYCRELVGYARGDIDKVKSYLSRVRFLGSENNRRKVKAIHVEKIDTNNSVVMGDISMRYLPDRLGKKWIRARPPYWGLGGRILCCDIGDVYGEEIVIDG